MLTDIVEHLERTFACLLMLLTPACMHASARLSDDKIGERTHGDGRLPVFWVFHVVLLLAAGLIG